VPLVTRVLVHLVRLGLRGAHVVVVRQHAILLPRLHERPRSRPGRRVVDGDVVMDPVWTDGHEALDDTKVAERDPGVGEGANGSTALLVRVTGRFDDQRVPFPVPA